MTVESGDAAREEESILRLVDEPIFTGLVRQWSAGGRSVPGRADPEWTALVGPPSWPGGGRRRRDTGVAATGDRPPVALRPNARREEAAPGGTQRDAAVVDLFSPRSGAPKRDADQQVCTCP